jgi:amino acid transporter
MVFSEYFLRMIGVNDPDTVHYTAALSILLIASFNSAGIQIAAGVQNVTAAAKYLALVILVFASFLIPAPVQTAAVSSAPTTIGLFGLALISILWVYDGWADLTFVSGEVRNPQRNLPGALFAGTLAVIAIYLAANAGYLHVLTIGEIANSKLVAADVADRLVGRIGVTFVSAAVMVSTFGTLNGSLMTGPRIFFAMADSGLFFKKIAAVHPRFGSPHVAIWFTAGLGAIFVMIRSFEQLADAFVLGIWPFYAAGTAAVYVLRRTRPDLPRPYRVWGYPVTPAIFLAGSLFLLGNALITDFADVWFVFAILLAGIPAYWIWHSMAKESGA